MLPTISCADVVELADTTVFQTDALSGHVGSNPTVRTINTNAKSPFHG
jgi:hypothetical protein